MSQGDATFNATHRIQPLLRELRHCAVEDMGEIIEAIRVIRRQADYLEAHPTWTAGSSDAVRRILDEAAEYARSHQEAQNPPRISISGDTDTLAYTHQKPNVGSASDVPDWAVGAQVRRTSGDIS